MGGAHGAADRGVAQLVTNSIVEEIIMNAIRTWVVVAVAVLSVFVASCATPTAQVPSKTQPALSAMAQPYFQAMRTAGIQSVQVFGNGARVRVSTNLGDIYLRYPAGLSPTAFVVYVDAGAAEVDSDSFTSAESAQYEAAIKAILPESIRFTNQNNTRVVQDRFGKS
jgi:hypothetical protein